MNVLTQDHLKSVLDYDPLTGIFTWNRSGRGIKIGKKAGATSRGYVYIKINYHLYLAHRLVFIYMTGKFPKYQVDHANHDKSDNRWHNLRECTHSENNQNKQLTKQNMSGYKGVSWHMSHKKWRAIITYNKKTKHIGYYDGARDAAKAYNQHAIKHHGEFAKLNNLD